jgi:tRNA-splicing ligase RtcB (3'-phosphate/5'-hydroxy nucleic acid ligase)
MEIKKISDYEWEIPKEGKMNVPCRIFASKKLLEAMQKDDTLEQVKNVAKLPGIIKHSIALCDAHNGYGYPIGGVAAFDLEKGVISPGGVGYDIDCSIRLLKTNLSSNDLKKNKKEIIHSLARAVPSGVGRGSSFQISYKELDEILEKGAEWIIEKFSYEKNDLKNLEDGGRLKPCNPEDVSTRAKRRGIGQLGTLGAGNHFLEIQEVEEIFNKEFAEKWGIEKGQVMIMIHCGSRGLGHQVASDYIKLIEEKYKWPEFDRELVNAPINSELGKKYLSAMNCAANFAFANKQLITHRVRENLKHYFPEIKIETIYEVCHNIAKIEEHVIDGEKKKVLVTRKGATRAFPSQPVIIPGSMGTSSYLLVGTETARELSFGSTAHGAGRAMSRNKALKQKNGDEVKKELEERGIDIESTSSKGLAEEASYAYKDIDEVVRVSDKVGLGEVVAKLKPLAVMKG